jgi:hypothetical protein
MSADQALSQMSEVAPAVDRVTGGVTNFYLIEESGRLTLVDAGTPRRVSPNASWDAKGEGLVAGV